MTKGGAGIICSERLMKLKEIVQTKKNWILILIVHYNNWYVNRYKLIKTFTYLFTCKFLLHNVLFIYLNM